MSSYGIFQGGLAISYLFYSSYYCNVLLGTHVGNDPHIIMASYAAYGDTYDFTNSFFNYTYNLATYESYTESYRNSYGITYAATYYKNTADHVRAIHWI